MLILEILIAMFAGIVIGIISGLTPGIHINMISLIILNLSIILQSKYGVSYISLAVFIISVGITHTFLDAIPSIFLGAPDENTILGVLPGHRYLLKGNAMMAVKLFTIGSIFGMVSGIILFPLLYFITKYSYHLFEKFFGLILIGVSLFMILRDEKKTWAILVYFISGIFGFLVFNIQMSDPLFPMLSGLYGISTLLISLKDNNKIPKQNNLEYTELETKQTILSLISGNFSAFIVSTFPGLSSSIAAMISIQFVKDLGDKGFMILMGCIGTSSFLLSLVALYAIDKARNGAVIVVSQLIEINMFVILVFLSISMIVGGISVVLSLWAGKIFCKIICKVNYRILVISIISLIIVLVFIVCSWMGIIVLLISTSIGIIPGIVKVQRTHSMACIVLPVILYFI